MEVHSSFNGSRLTEGLSFSAVLQGTTTELCSEGQAAGDGTAAQPKQSGAGETPTGWRSWLDLTFETV